MFFEHVGVVVDNEMMGEEEKNVVQIGKIQGRGMVMSIRRQVTNGRS